MADPFRTGDGHGSHSTGTRGCELPRCVSHGSFRPTSDRSVFLRHFPGQLPLLSCAPPGSGGSSNEFGLAAHRAVLPRENIPIGKALQASCRILRNLPVAKCWSIWSTPKSLRPSVL